jgi:23S rRNA pseudouridine1911/1915/1917 synthase
LKLNYTVDKEIIVKEYLKEVGISRSLGRKIKLYGNIYINSLPSFNYSRLLAGDELVIIYNEQINDEIIPIDKDLEILYEDDCFLIINKIPNLSVQPSRKHPDNLGSRLKHFFLKNDIETNIHIVNRLDYATSGLVIVAKDAYIKEKFSKIEIVKKYLAMVEGVLKEKSGTINLAIKRMEDHAIKREINQLGQTAITKYSIFKELPKYTILELELLTGRTHQIRLHLKAIGKPIIGDKLYNVQEIDDSSNRLLLHSYYLSFIHPVTSQEVVISNYPDWLESYK